MISEEDFSFGMYSPLAEDPLTNFSTSNANSEQFEFIDKTHHFSASTDGIAQMSIESSSMSAKSDQITNDTSITDDSHILSDNLSEKLLSISLSEADLRKTL